MKGKIKVWCHECDKPFNVDELQVVGTNIECPHCGTVHEVDSDYGDDGETFWYLNIV